MDFLVRPAATFEIGEAFAFYEMERAGLGVEFFSCLEVGFARLRRNPFLHPVYLGKVRKTYLRRFPFSIFYIAENDLISVVAVYHSSRDPYVLRERIKKEPLP